MFRLLAAGDIGMGADDARRPAIGLPRHHHAMSEYPLVAAVLAHDAVFNGVIGLAFKKGVQGGVNVRAILRRDVPCPAAGAFVNFILGIAEQLLPAGRPEGGVLYEVLVPDDVARASHGELPGMFAFAQQMFAGPGPGLAGELTGNPLGAGTGVAQRRQQCKDQAAERQAPGQHRPHRRIARGRRVRHKRAQCVLVNLPLDRVRGEQGRQHRGEQHHPSGPCALETEGQASRSPSLAAA